MIPNNAEAAVIQSNITGESGEFSFDADSFAHIMSILTNIYSDPEMAVVREYLTNAQDSHVMAGTTRPIEITTPGRFSKSYIIRDFGVGMSVNDIKNTWTKYGASTKRDSNAVVGMLGIGSKSALTYTNAFTITAWKGGVKAQAIVSINDEGVPVFHIVDTAASDEPSGVEINIPVKDSNSFARKTNEFLQYWPTGSVLIDGVANKQADFGTPYVQPITLDGGKTFVNADVYVKEQSYTATVVMGNVPYEVASEYIAQDLRDITYGFVVNLPIGSVNFEPGRERLQWNARTKAVVTQVSNGLFQKVFNEKVKTIVDAPDKKTAWTNWANFPYQFRKSGAYTNMQYKGMTFDTRFRYDHEALTWDYNDNGKVSERSWLDLGHAVRSCELIVTGVQSKVTSFQKKKIRYFCELHDLVDDLIILVNEDCDNEWLGDMTRVSIEDIKALKLPANHKAAPRGTPTYDVWRWDKAAGNHVCVQEQFAAKDAIYISPADMAEERWKKQFYPHELVKIFPTRDIVVLAKNRFDKFLRNHPNAIAAGKAVQAHVDALCATASVGELVATELTYSEKRFFEKVDISALADPALVEIAQVVQGKNTNTEVYKQAELLSNAVRRAKIHITIPAPSATKTIKVSERYPLIDSDDKKVKHVLVYTNAVYEMEYKNAV